MNQDSLTPRDYVAIAKRRKWYFIWPATILFFITLLATILWPPTYESQATVLVEQPEIPEDLVSTLVTDFLERRLEAITRRVMVTDNLLGIIERYGLYPDLRQRWSINDVVDYMRDKIDMEIVSADVTDPKSGRTTPSTVAFTVAFDYKIPEVAQRVANELVSLYLNENLRQRRQHATETAAFLHTERDRLEQQLLEIDRQFSEFKEANNGTLPDQQIFNEQELARAQQELRDLNRQAQTLQERQAYSQAQLALTDPYQLYATGNRVLSPKAQLENMRMQLASLQARYGPEHPDVKNTTREVKALETMLNVGPSVAELERDRAAAQADYDALRQKYTASHPDVQRAQRVLASAAAALAAAKSAPVSAGDTSLPDNPVYIQFQSDLNSTKAELQAVQDQRTAVAKEIQELEQLTLKAPLTERDYEKFTRQIEELTKTRDDLAQREMTAQLGQNIENELKGERFSLIEPPLLPTDPVKPNRLLIFALGFVLSIGGGVGAVAVTHILDDGVYTSKEIADIVGEPPLVIVPEIVTPLDRVRKILIRLAGILAVATAIGLILWLINDQLIPLDVLWFGIQRWFWTSIVPYLPVPGSYGGPAAAG